MSQLRVGIIGCGAIAQIQYLPILQDLEDRFTIAALSDLSPKLLDALGSEYGVPPEQQFVDYHDLVDSDIDAVIVCPFGSHAPASIAAAEKGKHVLVEKPMCTTPDEARRMAHAADESGVTLMVAYMKRYDPAYRYARERINEMSDVRFIQVNHLHPDNTLHLAQFDIQRFDDLPQQAREDSFVEHNQLVAQSLGIPIDNLTEPIRRAYTTVLGSMIHDIGNLHGCFGPPSRVLATEIWAEGGGITTTLEYDDGKRAVCTWIDLPELLDFKETLEVYGSRERVIVSFPTGFSRGLPSSVVLHNMDKEHRPWRKELTWQSDPFKEEVLHFYDSVVSGRKPDTEGSATVHDIELVRDIVLAYLNR